MHNFQTLYELADDINNAWCDAERVDWSEAEQLVSHCQALPSDCLAQLPEIKDILQYAADYDDWDSGDVASWPDLIRADLEKADKQYGYRADGDNWEVYSLSFTGEEEWKATVETESIAVRLVEALSPGGMTAAQAASHLEAVSTTALCVAEEIAEAHLAKERNPRCQALVSHVDATREPIGICELRSKQVMFAEQLEKAWDSLTEDEQLAAQDSIGAFDLEWVPAMMYDLLEECDAKEVSIFDAQAADIVRLTRDRLPEPTPEASPAI